MRIALKAPNGLWVCAENGGDDQGVLHANRTSIGNWERFYLHFQNGRIALESDSGRYLTADEHGVHASAKQIGPREEFFVEGELITDRPIAILAHDGFHYLGVRDDTLIVLVREPQSFLVELQSH